MVLHVFNPEHDLALAANLRNFTAPHAGRQLRADLGYIPALWAAADDYVLVENVEDAEWRFRMLVRRPFGRYVVKEQIGSLDISGVEVWGWDLAIRSFLKRYGVAERLLPSEEQIETIRELSHRRIGGQMLAQLQGDGIVGTSEVADSLSMVCDAIHRMGRIVVKAPWSSSGRGVRFFENSLKKSDEGWLQNVIACQGSVMVEPYYNKVKDLGMEFESDGNGGVRYLGLSLFDTSNGAYTGNVLADEETKEDTLSRYVSIDLLRSIQQKIISLSGILVNGKYQGPFGVDMMIVARDDQNGFMLHPCVEINLRRTMGHVALSLTPYTRGLPRVMSVSYNKDVYKMTIK